MNVRLYDGTVRCMDHMDASSYESDTTDPCLYCGDKVRAISPRTDERSYVTEYGDYVETHKRVINGETYVFHRIEWDGLDYISIYSGQRGKGRGHSWDIDKRTGTIFRNRQHPLFL
jgi:hypothetical protein